MLDRNWADRQRKRLLDAIQSANYTDLQCIEAVDYGTWKNKSLVFAGVFPVAQYYLTFPSGVPKFNIETTQEIADVYGTGSEENGNSDPDDTCPQPSGPPSLCTDPV